MRTLALLLAPVALFAGQARFARLGEFEGKVEIQLTAADPWMPAERNLPLPESTWMRTGPASRLEVELDEGSAWRLGPESQAEISDYTRLSTGQRVTLLSLDHGLAYFTGEPERNDSLIVALPGAQVTLSRGSRLRFEVTDTWSQISVIEGTVRFSSPAVEMDLHEGKMVRVQPANTSRFFLYPDITAVDLDRWSEQRDQAETNPASAGHVIERYGLVDLDAAGEWVTTDDLGTVWKPKAQENWVPYQKGRWRWYENLGYTWVSDDPWGWLPYHYGRWTRKENFGWVWAPSKNAVFKPGEVYWLRGNKLAGWGPLAPGEDWTPSVAPQQFLNANTTYAEFAPDSSVIDPAGFTARPKEALGAAVFALALPSPTFPPSRLEATRPVLRAGSTRVTPVLPGVTFQSPKDAPTQITQAP
ncbi:MAG TPA: FecR family protein, partial [Bryobacteraceae bacterium]